MKRHYNWFSANFFKAVFKNTSIRDCCNTLSAHLNVNHLYGDKQLLDMLVDLLPEYNHQELVHHIENFYRNFELFDKKLDFFDVLFCFSDNMIVRFENNFCFNYNYTDIWRIVAKELGEECFVISAIVQNDLRRKKLDRKDMSWSFNIEHDNFELKKLLRRGVGISENHFHLRGASPYFDTSWVYLMNDISGNNYENALDTIDKNRLNRSNNIHNDYSLVVMWRKAAAMRLLLYMAAVIDDPDGYSGISEEYFSDYCDMMYQNILCYEKGAVCSFPISWIEKYFKKLNVNSEVDYAANFPQNRNEKYRVFSGERFLIYTCLKKVLLRDNHCEIIKEILHLYLIIKHRFYSEMIQSNSRIGFYNFTEYQDRKDFIIPWSMEEDVAADTICSVIENNKIYRAELRISPQEKAVVNLGNIELYDRAIERAIKYSNAEGTLSKDRNFFYTLHFTKRAETPSSYQNGFCRSQKLRESIMKRALAIEELRGIPRIASRIYGIDACAAEIDCRPEVFGSVFRRLKDYDSYNNADDLPQLKATYHVGEDNYDIVDGIRAIDEAITFLDLRSGCRLGHATFLGLDPYEFYKNKNPIAMPKQNFLDNIVWMYFFIRKYSVNFDELPQLIAYLENQFEKYFYIIYSDDIQPLVVSEYLKNKKHKFGSINAEKCRFDIYNYYLSYLLRGDDPELYKEGYRENLARSEEYRICKTLDKMKEARKTFEAHYLYYVYHYSADSVLKSMSTTIERLPDYFIKGVSLIQRQLRQKISEMGVAIETNPTSNLYISPINSYNEHPIYSFYNNGLSKDYGEIQLNVSINTDDKSLFSTSLSNEYAYLMFYLEHQTDNNGKRKYSRFEILNWLDEIRKMGNEQSFLQ